MKVLTIPDLSDDTVAELARRAATRGVSVVDEARRMLQAAVRGTKATDANVDGPVSFKDHLLNFPKIADEDLWMFDRHDPRNVRPERAPLDFSD